MGESSTVDRLVAELRTGAPEEPGTFTVDGANADRKLRAIRLDNPLHWVLVALRGAVRAGATTIEVEDAGGDLVLRWPESLALPTGDLLPTAALGSTGDQAGLSEVLLAAFIGINHGLREVSIASGSRMLIVDAGSVREREVPAKAGTRLVGHGALVAPLDGERAEHWVLRKRGRYLEIPLEVGGVRASSGLDGEVDLDAETIELRKKRDREVLRAGRVDADHGEVRLLADGVWVQTVLDEELPSGFVAVVRHQHDMDAGQAQVVRDSEHLRGLDVARSVARKQRALDPPPSKRVVDRLEKELEKHPVEREVLGASFVFGGVVGVLVAAATLVFYFSRFNELEGLLITLFMTVIMSTVAGGMWGACLHTVMEARHAARIRVELRRSYPPHHPGRAFVRLQLDSRPFRARWKLIVVLTPLLVVALFLPFLLGPELEAKAALGLGLPVMIGAVFGLVFGSMIADTYRQRLHGKEGEKLPAEPPL